MTPTRSLDRRELLKATTLSALASVMSTSRILAQSVSADAKADYSVRIRRTKLELAPNHSVHTTTYNNQFPGPLIRLTEGRRVIVDIFNDTDVPEQLHWHGQNIPVDVDGAAEEGTPYIPAHSTRRISYTPGPSG